jgi:hypothetical protein
MIYDLINEKLDMLRSLSGPDPGRTTIPVSEFVQEAHDLYLACTKNKEVLIQSGFNWKLAEDLPVRIDALRVSEAKWKSMYKHNRDCDAEWGVALKDGRQLRDELAHNFFYAFRKKPRLYAKVKKIKKGNTIADIIQDLMDLSVLGNKQKKDLIDIGFNLKLLDEAESKSIMLPGHLAKVTASRMESSPLLLLRNRAYAHLKEAVIEIREAGKFKLWRDKNKRKAFTSAYIAKMNSRSRKK